MTGGGGIHAVQLSGRYKGEVVSILQKKGYNVRSVHALNLILQEMGLLEHYGNNWLTTKAGVPYTIYNSQVYDADAWHPSIVEAVAHHLDGKEARY